MVTLGLGIGANTAVFSLMDRILLRPLPFPEEDRLISMFHRQEEGNRKLSATSYPDYEYYRDHNPVFADLMAFARVPAMVQIADRFESVIAELVTPNYFSVLRVPLQRGRTFLEEDDSNAVVVISDSLWKGRFGSDPSVIGKPLKIQDTLFTVVGVAQPGFKGYLLDWQGALPQIWVPIGMHRQAIPSLGHRVDPLEHADMPWLLVVGRLNDDVTISQARPVTEGVNAQLHENRKERDSKLSVELLPTREARIWPPYRANLQRQFNFYLAVVALVLLIACLNVANLSLVNALRRRREMALRMALGAARLRLVRQLLTESFVLALSAIVPGLFLAQWFTAWLLRFPSAFGVGVGVDAGLHWRVLLFACLLATGVAVICGVLPAFQAVQFNLMTPLRPAGSEVRSSGSLVRNFLIVGQVSAALLVLVLAGLFVHTLQSARSVRVTNSPERVLEVKVDFFQFESREEQVVLSYRELLRRVRGLGNVRSAALISNVRLGRIRALARIRSDPGDSGRRVYFNLVSPGYFEAMELTMKAGRDFSPSDTGTTILSAVINEQMARELWPGEDPLGREFERVDDQSRVRVIGLVDDGGWLWSFREDPQACFYLSLQPESRNSMILLARFVGPRAAAAAAISEQVRQLDERLPPAQIVTTKERYEASLAREKVSVLLLSSLAIVATLLAAVGIYGVVSFLVSQRTREIAIRTALGATPADILRGIMKQGLLLLLAGVVVGLMAAAAVTRLIQSMLYGVSPTEPAVFVAAVALLSLITLMACYLPARRATRIDPMTVLRHE